jgi:UDP-N-acetyl-D-glucosamine dehydrogenase
MSKENLINRIRDRQAVIGVVGLGYVGLPLVLAYIDVGFKVIGFDVDLKKIDKLSVGKSYIEHISSASIAAARKQGFEATENFQDISKVDAVIICVPTPLNKYREPDLSFVIKTVDTITPYLRKCQIVSLESTTYPGTTNEEVRPRLESVGFKMGDDMFLVFSPEREDPGNQVFTTRTIPKVCGGDTKNCLAVGVALYEVIVDRIIPVSSTRTAEMTKLLENIHRAVNIGLVNEMKIVTDKMGIDIHEVINAAATKPFGFVPYFPGPGIGGHCIPVDPFYLTWKAREFGVHTRFIELAGEINNGMPEWVINKITSALNERQRSLSGAKVLVLGITYKKDVDDMRESPAVIIMELLRAKGAVVNYSDPHVPIFPRMREHFFDLESVKINPDIISCFDCVVLATNHKDFDYGLIENHARLIVDTRGVYKQAKNHIIRA